MAFADGARVGPYEILSFVGAGGMGEVYQARDTRLNRLTALKVLGAELRADAASRARFQREAAAVARLNHPHICTLYDVGVVGDADYMVFEYLEGTTLARRIAEGPISPAQAAGWGAQIAEALHAAHAHGVVHRDLKPANVMLVSGRVKLLDFGLAAFHGGRPDPDMTLTAYQTSVGTVLGTIPYMSPEQVSGATVDGQSDIWALGVVLYEMIAGRPPFAGPTAAAVAASILASEPPPLETLSPRCPPLLARAVRGCLEKDVTVRWHCARDLAAVLQWEFSVAAPATGASQRPVWRVVPWILAGAMAALLLAAWARPGEQQLIQARFRLSDPYPSNAPSVAVSPDGRAIAYTAAAEDGAARLWVRALDSSAARAVEGAEAGSNPFWLPDSRSLGFRDGTALKRVDLEGGPPIILAQAPALGGSGTWNHEGVIVFTPDNLDLYRVPADGSASPQPLGLERPQGMAHQMPQFLPDGRHVMFAATGEGDAGVHVAAIDQTWTRRILTGVTTAVPAPPHHVLFVRDGALFAQAFDFGALRTTGDPVQIAPGVARRGNHIPLSASATGFSHTSRRRRRTRRPSLRGSTAQAAASAHSPFTMPGTPSSVRMDAVSQWSGP